MGSNDVRQIVLSEESLYGSLTKCIASSAFGVWKVATFDKTITVSEAL